jgi:hypothetical protein
VHFPQCRFPGLRNSRKYLLVVQLHSEDTIYYRTASFYYFMVTSNWNRKHPSIQPYFYEGDF